MQQAKLATATRVAAIESAAAAKSRFLAHMSHEARGCVFLLCVFSFTSARCSACDQIRTPLNGIIGSSSLLQLTPLSQPQQELTNTIVASGESLLVLVSDILDFSHLDASSKISLDMRPVELEPLLDRALQIVGPSSTSRRVDVAVSFAPGSPKAAVVDPHRLLQACLRSRRSAHFSFFLRSSSAA